MLLVVLGAGASYDAFHPAIEDYSGAWRPPLADALFGDRPAFSSVVQSVYPQALVAVRRLRERVAQGEYVEEALAQMVADSERYPPLRRGLAAIRFYLQHILRECGRDVGAVGFTNHVSLVSQLDQWRHGRDEPVVYVAFNYDTFLEQACARVLGTRYEDMDAYIRDARVSIHKLHGSVDWWHPVATEFPGGGSDVSLRDALIERVAEVEVLGDEYEWAEPGALIRSNDGSAGGKASLRLPAIALPIARKGGFESPAPHLDRLRTLLPGVDRLICVGWRGRESDFVALLEEAMARPIQGLVVSGSVRGAREVRKQLSRLPRISWMGDVTSDARGGLGAFSKLVTEDHLSNFVEHTKM